MTIDASLWAWIGAVGMFVGTIPPLWRMYTRPGQAKYYATLAGVTGIAAVAYVFMGLGIGTFPTPGGDLPMARYVDWLLTTPLLILYLAFLARASRRVIGGLIALDVVVIVAGVAAAATTGVVSWASFAVASLAYLGLVYGLLVSLPAGMTTAGDRLTAVFTTLRNLTVVLWTLYPVVWLLAPTGTGLILPTTEMLIFVYLDFISKVGFVAIAVMGGDALDALADRTSAPANEGTPTPEPAD